MKFIFLIQQLVYNAMVLLSRVATSESLVSSVDFLLDVLAVPISNNNSRINESKLMMKNKNAVVTT